MQFGDGLKPSRNGKRIQFAGGKQSAVDGPFAETQELIAGSWIWNVKSMEEAMTWASRCPDPATPEVKQQTARLRAEFERQQGK